MLNAASSDMEHPKACLRNPAHIPPTICHSLCSHYRFIIGSHRGRIEKYILFAKKKGEEKDSLFESLPVMQAKRQTKHVCVTLTI